ncbi:MAG: YfhO family protein [Cyclobacteriaceae bacterium]
MTLGKKALHHFIPIAIFFVLVSVFFGPLYTGKTLVQSDNIQLTGVNKEVADYKAKGEDISWNNREFSGVPLQSGASIGVFKFLNGVLFQSVIPKPVAMVFFLFLGFYLLLQVLGVARWLSGIGAFAYAFSSFNMISVEVGHDNKVLAMAFIALILAGVISVYKGELRKGALLTIIGAGFQLHYGHIQITYYTLIIVLTYLILVIVNTSRDHEWKSFFKRSAVLVAVTILALSANFSKLYSTIEYADYSTRGGSELTTTEDNRSTSPDGLSKEYALSWSSGKMEVFTILFPYFHGGASQESLSEDSNTYKALASRGVDKRTIDSVTSNAPLYWGTQPFTGGPIYFGAIMCFLFLLAFLVLDNTVKWWVLGLTMLSLLLAMGKNLERFTDIFFYYVPLYNKFRSVTMIFAIAQLTVPMLGILAVDKVLKDGIDKKKIANQVIQAGGLLIVLGLGMIFFKSSFFDFKGQNDLAYGFPDWLLQALVSDRKGLFVSDIVRSIVFIGLSGSALWLFLRGIIRPTHALAGLALLVLVDLWAVNKRYIGEDDFQSKKRVSQMQFQPSVVDIQIQQDKSYYRVANLASANPFSDGVTAYHHYSVFGYSAIKMQRYQELIDRYLGKVDQDILGMLNTKYLIVKGQNGLQVQQNISALGNAWLVQSLRSVSNADAELEAIGSINLAIEAVYDERFSEIVGESTYSGNGMLEFIDYHPEKMVYKYSSEEVQFGVFSEVYYAPGWNAYIDGEEVDHIRVNYILRGMELPSGDHEIVFKYEPASVVYGNYLSWLFLLALIMIGVLWTYSKFKRESAQ